MTKPKKVKPVTFKAWVIETHPGKYYGSRSFGMPAHWRTRKDARYDLRYYKSGKVAPRTAAVRRVTVSITAEA